MALPALPELMGIHTHMPATVAGEIAKAPSLDDSSGARLCDRLGA